MKSVSETVDMKKSERKEPKHFKKGSRTGLDHLLNATKFSLTGLKNAFLRESAFRHEVVAFGLLISSGALLASSLLQILTLVCVCCFTLSIELLNSGIEATVDRISTEQNELSKIAKDYGSAAVMVSLITVAIVWTYIAIESLNLGQ
tara:strand:- start:385 stop:825 length:441 start_codon:yes stop_codon:yes gene_type:complete